jgi:hypothetical protein
LSDVLLDSLFALLSSSVCLRLACLQYIES